MIGLNKEVLVIRNKSALDAFKLFYEELHFSKPSNRIRRQRPVTATK